MKIRREESEEEEQRRQKSAKKLEEKHQNRRINDEIVRNKEIERQLQILENLKVGIVHLKFYDR